jgi:hypothetical protein
VGNEDHRAEEKILHEEEQIEEHSFEDLAKGLAAGSISRRGMLKLVSATIFGGALSTLFPGVAEARRHRKRHRRKKCPPGTVRVVVKSSKQGKRRRLIILCVGQGVPTCPIGPVSGCAVGACICPAGTRCIGSGNGGKCK